MGADEFKDIFMPIHQKMFRIAFRLVENKEQAGDIVQETLIKLWNNKDSLSEVNSYEAYAITVLKNTSYDFIRRPKVNQEMYNFELADNKSIISDVEVADDLSTVQILIKELPEPQQEIMILKHWEDHSDKEISEITGISEGNIRVILSRTRKIIKDKFLKISTYECK